MRRFAFKVGAPHLVGDECQVAKSISQISASDSLWQLQLDDNGPGWPEGLARWLEDPQLWHYQLALGSPLVQGVLAAHGGGPLLDQGPGRFPLSWVLEKGSGFNLLKPSTPLRVSRR